MVGGGALDVRGNYVRVINCIVHDTVNGHGINAIYGAKGQVMYGNIIYKVGIASAHKDEDFVDGIRASNAYETDGVKYIVGNVVVGTDDTCKLCNGFGGITDPQSNEFDSERASGFYLEV